VNKDHDALYIFRVKIFISCANTRASSAAPTPQYTVVLAALAIIVLLDYGARLIKDCVSAGWQPGRALSASVLQAAGHGDGNDGRLITVDRPWGSNSNTSSGH
jgi:hypothetical protein